MWRSLFLPGIDLPRTDLIAQRARKLSAVIAERTVMAYPPVEGLQATPLQ
jgi:hypothetical protein